jgi:hypothetical protein
MTRTCVALIVLLAIVFAAPSHVAGQSQVTLVPTVSIGSMYDDNLFAKTVGSGDQMTLITPGLELGYETPVTSLLGSYFFEAQRSFDHPALDRLDARRHALFDGRFRLTPHVTFSLAGRYDRTDTAGDLAFNTGVLTDRRRAERWQAGPSFSFQASPHVFITGLYDWTTETVVDAEASDEHVARLGLTRQFSPRGTFGLSYLGRRFISAGQTSTSTAALFAWTYAVAPATLFSLQAGPRYATARDTVAPEIVVSFGRKAPNIVNYGMDYWRGESIILGVLGPVEVHSGTAHVMWPIHQKYEIGVHGGVFNTQTLTQGQARVYHGEIVGSWSLKPSLVLAVSYGADFQRGDIRSSLLSDKQVIRHVVLVRLTAAPRLTRLTQGDDPLRPLGEPPATGLVADPNSSGRRR